MFDDWLIVFMQQQQYLTFLSRPYLFQLTKSVMCHVLLQLGT